MKFFVKYKHQWKCFSGAQADKKADKFARFMASKGITAEVWAKPWTYCYTVEADPFYFLEPEIEEEPEIEFDEETLRTRYHIYVYCKVSGPRYLVNEEWLRTPEDFEEITVSYRCYFNYYSDEETARVKYEQKSHMMRMDEEYFLPCHIAGPGNVHCYDILLYDSALGVVLEKYHLTLDDKGKESTFSSLCHS